MSALPASSENTTWSWDAGTSKGTFAWSNTSWNSLQLFGSGDYSAYTTLNIETESVSADHFRIVLKFSNGASQVIITPVTTGSNSITLASYTTLDNLAHIETIRLSGANDVTGDVIVSRIYLEGPDVDYIEAIDELVTTAAPNGTIDLNNLTGTNTSWSVAYPTVLENATILCGNGDGSSESTHVNISGYDYICFSVTDVVTTGQAIRVWIWDGEKGGSGSVKTFYAKPLASYSTANYEVESNVSARGTYVVRISGYNYLKGIKTYYGGGKVTVSRAYVCKGETPVSAFTGKYTLVGKDPGSVSFTAALADASATSYDATGLIGTGITLAPTNPNALFIANAGVLTNAQNVIVDDVCANLVLTDNHPFKAPADFTATSATYNTTINTTAKAGTLYLPYAAAIPSGVKAYTLTYTSGSEVTATEITTGTIPANTPVLLNGEGSTAFNGTGVAIDADGAFASGALTGVLEQGFVPKDSYVLQNGDSGLGFYKVAADNTIGIKPFRAYLTATGGGSRVAINFADETTGINAVQGSDVKVNGSEAVYNLQGQRVAQPTKGLYIVNGKKVILK